MGLCTLEGNTSQYWYPTNTEIPVFSLTFYFFFLKLYFVQFMLKHCNVTGHSICDSNPCQNGARCEDMTDHFVCRCTSGYTGTKCEHGK